MTELALRAAATLHQLDRRALWRRLIVTALEDLGVGEIDLLARIVAASRDRAWRQRVGGDWPVVTALIAQACAGTRDQSANDLYNIAQNAPELDDFKASLAEAYLPDLLDVMTDEDRPIGDRGAAVLIALGEPAGPAAPVHITPDPGAVFAAFAQAGRYSHVAAIYALAHRMSGLGLAPLSLCLWSASRDQPLEGRDDDLPPVTWNGDIPSFCKDQYTRTGGEAIRRFAYANPAWASFADRWAIPRADWKKAAGELLFRVEGAAVTNRRTWDLGQSLYARSASLGAFMPEAAVPDGMGLIRRELPHLDQLRLR